MVACLSPYCEDCGGLSPYCEDCDGIRYSVLYTVKTGDLAQLAVHTVKTVMAPLAQDW